MYGSDDEDSGVRQREDMCLHSSASLRHEAAEWWTGCAIRGFLARVEVAMVAWLKHVGGYCVHGLVGRLCRWSCDVSVVGLDI